ncbi:MAG: hypothetical protein WBG70_19325 [Spirulinaceae cyanobacterium]
MKMPKQAVPIARNLNTTAQAADQNGVEASANWGRIGKGLLNTLPVLPLIGSFFGGDD